MTTRFGVRFECTVMDLSTRAPLLLSYDKAVEMQKHFMAHLPEGYSCYIRSTHGQGEWEVYILPNSLAAHAISNPEKFWGEI